MTKTKDETKNEPKTETSPALQLSEADIEARNRYMADAVISPDFSAATVVSAYLKPDKIDLLALMEQLRAQHESLSSGNLSQAENMLMSQAVALQSIFTKLAIRALSTNGVDQIQSILGLALRAQSGSRASLQALGELKNPRQVTFAKQPNIANGPQQVNNTVAVAHAHAHEENADSANKLSGGNHELLQDTRTSGATIAGHPIVAAVEKVHRAKVRRG